MAAELGEGDVVLGRYVIERAIAEGGMGRVVSARHLELDTGVAIKLLKRDKYDARDVQRFRREARAAAHLRSEHVVRVLDVGVLDGDRPCIVMELVDGIDLGTKLETEGPLALEVAVGYVIQACEGLAEAHRLGIVHRDLKPSNLLLTSRPDGSELLKISDFGIAKWASGPASSLTTTADFLGSPKYMSPEQVREASDVDARADIWSLGVTLYQLVTGRLPFEAYTTAGVLVAITADEPVAPSVHVPSLDRGLEAVILRCLSKKPEGRPESTEALVEALLPFAGVAGERALPRIASTLRNPRLVLQPSASQRRPAPIATREATATEATPPPSVAIATAMATATDTAGVTTSSRATAQPAAPRRASATPIALAAVAVFGIGAIAFAATRPSASPIVRENGEKTAPSTSAAPASSPSSSPLGSTSAAPVPSSTTAATTPTPSETTTSTNVSAAPVRSGRPAGAEPPGKSRAPSASTAHPASAPPPGTTTTTATATATATVAAPASAPSKGGDGLDLGPRK
ncbi:MAG: serine/threonine protein kinase [Deltaproteobacteria bacterium]|nr:serine/threonine protein kinase [Deltaproteobacteria bacterium]